MPGFKRFFITLIFIYLTVCIAILIFGDFERLVSGTSNNAAIIFLKVITIFCVTLLFACIVFLRINESRPFISKNNPDIYKNLINERLANAIPDTFLFTDLKGKILFINKAGIEKVGKNKETILGKNILTFVAPESIDKAIANLNGVMEYKPELSEYALILKDSKIICEINFELLRNSGYDPLGIILIVRDITVKKELELELRRKKETYKSLIETSPNVIFEINESGHFIYLNSKAEEMLGYPLEELYKMRFFDLLVPSEIPRVSHQFMQDTDLSNKRLSYEVKALHGKTGTERILDINSTPVLEKGKLNGFRGIVGDVTLRHKQELAIREFRDQLEMVLKAGKMVIWHIYLPAITVSIDSPKDDLLGYTKEEMASFSYEQLSHIIHPEDLKDVLEYYRSVYEGKAVNNMIEYRMINRDGKTIWVLCIAESVKFNENNEAVELICLLEDISTRKDGELKLLEANNTKDKLFLIIAHDLKNPFNTILGFSELLKRNADKYDTAKVVEMADMISNSAGNLYSLLENLLQWANTQRGNPQYNPIVFNLESVIVDEIKSVEHIAGNKNISINQVNNNHYVRGDYNMLKIVIRNLLINAIKFSYPNGVIEICSAVKPDTIEVTFTDHGTGMNEEVKNRILSNASIVSETGTSNESGTGLGLMICKDFIKKNKGKFSVESTVGEGSHFSFTIPSVSADQLCIP